MKRMDGLIEERDLPQIRAILLARLEEVAGLLRDAASLDQLVSFRAQARLAREFRMVLPFRVLMLPRKMKDAISDIRPIPPWQPTRCPRCGGRLVDMECEGRFVAERVDGREIWRRCRAKWGRA